jgi:hypothetical protein
MVACLVLLFSPEEICSSETTVEFHLTTHALYTRRCFRQIMASDTVCVSLGRWVKKSSMVTRPWALDSGLSGRRYNPALPDNGPRLQTLRHYVCYGLTKQTEHCDEELCDK